MQYPLSSHLRLARLAKGGGGESNWFAIIIAKVELALVLGKKTNKQTKKQKNKTAYSTLT